MTGPVTKVQTHTRADRHESSFVPLFAVIWIVVYFPSHDTIYVRLPRLQHSVILHRRSSSSCGTISNPCSTLQAGIDASSSGDRVLILGNETSTTHECDVTVPHSLTLVAESRVRLECSSSRAGRPAVLVTLKASSNGVPLFALYNFEISGSSFGALDVRVDGKTDCSIVLQNCDFVDNSVSKDSTTREYVSPVAIGNTDTSTDKATTTFSLKVDQCSFVSNSATGAAVAMGAGALTVWWNKPRASIVTISSCHFANNSADFTGKMASGGAGAVSVYYLCNSACKLSNQHTQFALTNSTWEDNWSTVGSGAVKVLVKSVDRGNVSHNSFTVDGCAFRRNVLSWGEPEAQVNDGAGGAFVVTSFIAGRGLAAVSSDQSALKRDLSGTYAFFNSFAVIRSVFTDNKCLVNREVPGDSFASGAVSYYWNSNLDVQTSHNTVRAESSVFERNVVNSSTDSGSNAVASIVVYYDATFTKYGRSQHNQHAVINCSFVDNIMFVTSGQPDSCSIGEDMAASAFLAYYHTGQNSDNVNTLTGNRVLNNQMTSTGRSYMNAAVPFAATYINCNNFPGMYKGMQQQLAKRLPAATGLTSRRRAVVGATICPRYPPDFRCQSSSMDHPPTFVLSNNEVHGNVVETDDAVSCFQYWTNSTDGGYIVVPCASWGSVSRQDKW